jgi:hypothetical protein
VASLTEDGNDGRHTMADLAADLSELIALGLVAVTGSYPDLRYVVTPAGEAELWLHEAEVRRLARARRAAGQLGTVVPLSPPNGASTT